MFSKSCFGVLAIWLLIQHPSSSNSPPLGASAGSTSNQGQNVSALSGSMSDQEPVLPPKPVVSLESSRAEKFFLAVAGGFLGLVGTYFAFVLVPAKIKRFEYNSDYIQTQLNNLYGPLLGECVRTDRIFLRMEGSIASLFGANSHHHSKLEPLIADYSKSGRESLKQLVETIIRDVYHPCNAEKVRLLKNYVHLYGPYPPLSFFLFLIHAAELEATIALGNNKSLLRFSSDKVEGSNVVTISPFPSPLTAEVLAKVVLLELAKRIPLSNVSDLEDVNQREIDSRLLTREVLSRNTSRYTRPTKQNSDPK